ncbi:Salicylate hydroxylase [Diplodia seriata]|uniref:Salicylate hydroxylase n=1 Tax=Diplodia seriata TaxID=420778 RepID=A0A1S8BFH8_9PEZI|nr:Salicylate hydroxylase [Diplodia seriata]
MTSTTTTPPPEKNPHADDKKLHVAIAGAGIAGLTAAIALKKRLGGDRVDVQLYDKASALREIGASIALGPNGLRSLERLGVGNALDDDVAFRGPSGLPMIYRWVSSSSSSSSSSSFFFFFFWLLF